MTRIFDPRSRYRTKKIVAGTLRCKFCNKDATSIRLPHGDPVCKEHDDARS